MKKLNIEKFKGSYNLVWWTIFGGIVAFGFSIDEQGFSDNIFKGLLIYLVLIAFIVLAAKLTYIFIENKTKLIGKVFLGLAFEGYNFKIHINNIIEINRTSAFVFKHWGSRLHLKFINEDGQEDFRVIQESMYSVKTIKKLLKRLKEINPSIQLHPQYQDLIDGKLTRDDEDYFKKLPIT